MYLPFGKWTSHLGGFPTGYSMPKIKTALSFFDWTPPNWCCALWCPFKTTPKKVPTLKTKRKKEPKQNPKNTETETTHHKKNTQNTKTIQPKKTNTSTLKKNKKSRTGAAQKNPRDQLRQVLGALEAKRCLPNWAATLSQGAAQCLWQLASMRATQEQPELRRSPCRSGLWDQVGFLQPLL